MMVGDEGATVLLANEARTIKPRERCYIQLIFRVCHHHRAQAHISVRELQNYTW